MRNRNCHDIERMHWEQLVRTMIETIGEEKLAEIIDYVLEQMADERRKLFDYAVETHCVEH